MLSTKEKMLTIINTLPDDRHEDELIEEFLIKLMLERSKEQFDQGQHLEHETVKQGLLK